MKFIYKVVSKISKDNLGSFANELTYKIVLSIFPFLIFLITLLGFVHIDIDNLLLNIAGTVPNDIIDIIKNFYQEVITQRHLSLLSGSLITSIYSASTGFDVIIRGINMAYTQKDSRNFIYLKLISVLLVILFTFAIFVSLIILVYGSTIVNFINNYNIIAFRSEFYNFLILFTLFLILVFTMMIIYKISNCQKVSFTHVMPGSIFTVVFWFLSSKLYNIYIENFANYSKTYGSLGSIFILMLWINILSYLMLIGNEVNSILNIKN